MFFCCFSAFLTRFKKPIYRQNRVLDPVIAELRKILEVAARGVNGLIGSRNLGASRAIFMNFEPLVLTKLKKGPLGSKTGLFST